MKKVLVTGSSRGIGAAVAKRLVGSGYEVVLHGRSKSESLTKLASELKSEFLVFDVGDTGECRAVLEDFVAKNELWGVVLNAGITDDATFAGISEESWKSVLNTNLNSFFNVLNPLVLPLARRKKGRIVVMSSVSGVVGNRGQSNYAASKAGLIGAAKSLALELASRNITVNVVAPGLIETDMTSGLAPEVVSQALQLVPAKRAGSADEVAALVEFLLGESASYITRQVIGVNGGLA